MKEFNGKNIMVIGASSGLGEALVNQFVEENAQVIAVSRSIEKTVFDGPVEKIACDISKTGEIRSLFDTLTDKNTALDVVITTAGLGLVKSFAEVTDDEIERLTRIDLLGPLFIARESFKNMTPYKKGHILTVSSTTGLEGKSGEVVYSALKQGLRGMNQALSKEAAEHGIEATCIFPGGMRSENFWTQARPGNDISEYMDPKDVSGKIIEMLRMDGPHPVEMVIRRPISK